MHIVWLIYYESYVIGHGGNGNFLLININANHQTNPVDIRSGSNSVYHVTVTVFRNRRWQEIWALSNLAEILKSGRYEVDSSMKNGRCDHPRKFVPGVPDNEVNQGSDPWESQAGIHWPQSVGPGPSESVLVLEWAKNCKSRTRPEPTRKIENLGPFRIDRSVNPLLISI